MKSAIVFTFGMVMLLYGLNSIFFDKEFSLTPIFGIVIAIVGVLIRKDENNF